MKYVIPTGHAFDKVNKALTRAGKKAAKYGQNFGYSFSDAYYAERRYTDNGKTVLREMVEVVDVDIDCETIKKDGYAVVAKVEYGEPVNFVTVFGDCEKNPEWATIRTLRCDHCGTGHKRNVVYIVRNGDDEKMVGSSCLKDYCGINPELVLAMNELHDIILDNQKDSYDFDEPEHVHQIAYDVEDVLAGAFTLIREQGYVKSDCGNSNKERLVKGWDFAVTDEDRENAKSMITDVLSMGYEEALKNRLDDIYTIISQKYCKIGRFGYVAYAPIAYGKYVDRKAEKAISDYVGMVGEKVSVTVAKFRKITSWVNGYGVNTVIYGFTDADGNEFVWKTSKSISGASEVVGTIKEHSEYNGQKQTVLTRCKVTEKCS